MIGLRLGSSSSLVSARNRRHRNANQIVQRREVSLAILRIFRENGFVIQRQFGTLIKTGNEDGTLLHRVASNNELLRGGAHSEISVHTLLALLNGFWPIPERKVRPNRHNWSAFRCSENYRTCLPMILQQLALQQFQKQKRRFIHVYSD